MVVIGLREHEPIVRHVYVPMKKEHAERAGLSERIIKNKLEKEGWTVWRGGSMNILNEDDVYPNVRRKYTKLFELLDMYRPDTSEVLQYICHVHHGMPDFVCFRHGKFKFVECKLCHEQLSSRQKKCIPKLQGLGFTVEVHKLVDKRTKMRIADINLVNGQKQILEKQMTLKNKFVKHVSP